MGSGSDFLSNQEHPGKIKIIVTAIALYVFI